jgi:hypothetical protein
MALSRFGPADLFCPIGGGLVEISAQSAMRRSGHHRIDARAPACGVA